MKGVKLRNFILDQLNCGNEINVRPGHCVIDYVWTVCNGRYGFKRYSKDSFERELKRFATSYDSAITTRELLEWRDALHKNVSIYALDPTYKCFEFSPARNNKESVRLCYVVLDNHCYPILNEEIITRIASKANGTIDQLVQKIEYSCESDNLLAPQSLDENSPIWELGHKDHVVVLPENFHVQDAMRLSIKKTGATVPFFKYNNKKMLSAFVHPKLETLFVENDDFLVRKNVCEKLYKKWPVLQFRFKNQSLTKIANDLFEVAFGYLPKSTYNEKTVETINANKPNALIQSYVTSYDSELTNIQLSDLIQDCKKKQRDIRH